MGTMTGGISVTVIQNIRNIILLCATHFIHLCDKCIFMNKTKPIGIRFNEEDLRICLLHSKKKTKQNVKIKSEIKFVSFFFFFSNLNENKRIEFEF